MSPKMPEFNIFIMTGSPKKEYEDNKKQKNKRETKQNKLGMALRRNIQK